MCNSFVFHLYSDPVRTGQLNSVAMQLEAAKTEQVRLASQGKTRSAKRKATSTVTSVGASNMPQGTETTEDTPYVPQATTHSKYLNVKHAII